MITPTILVVDFGSQYVQLIARRVREQHVHSIIVPPTITAEQVREHRTVGIILSGGPSSVYADGAPKLADPRVLEMGLPTLGICYGLQLACQMLGGAVSAASAREFGRTHLTVTREDPLLAHIAPHSVVWMSHGDVVDRISEDFIELARTDNSPFAAVRHRTRPFWGVQFHPEVTHTPCGEQIFRNFLYDICRCEGDWQVGNFTQDIIEGIRERVGPKARVICGLSGGVDSSVAAVLIHKAIGERLTCIFVDNGLLRNRETELVESTFRRHFHIDLRVADAAEAFLQRLDGVTDPQQKRIIIGHEFIDVFRREAEQLPGVEFLAQGTLYPDVIESGHSVGGHAVGIKLHHNVGGLPAELGFKLLEPLRDLFKDEVRRVGEHLGLPEEIVWRHPFPGPGLAVRIIGAVTPRRLDLLRACDDIVLEEIRAAGWYRKIAQGFVVLVPVSTVGVMGDDRTYADQHVAAVRFVESADFMTADWVRIDHDVLANISTRIINEVRGVNRVVYDISTKPPSTIEWE
ncbi:MAG: glutamine-hydrolyzing GMP synthase [Phycisphaerae bacterium]|nr:MAG: glutamine-hydrolyzing GMP synthase [Planctomycetota bacterium]KAB2949011.1 MAG: glutamine-hydrolyzing GMP synthase [Phycisphaerae bacterium]MBE7455634.1 glutamine-hydrolyzing GMP synthase [Planctomycetia bacterium]MCK6463270.1 glutamine-hydrolyzing GMP synthase [Phycisphaerae bacterium]MCL4716892.1 glutamine-hydrolyzing GMP synthase [Phycisphaerae bacterium]